jgi:hypothetical protein
MRPRSWQPNSRGGLGTINLSGPRAKGFATRTGQADGLIWLRLEALFASAEDKRCRDELQLFLGFGAVRLHQHLMLFAFFVGVGGFIHHRPSGLGERFDHAELPVGNFLKDGGLRRGGNGVHGGRLLHQQEIALGVHAVVPGGPIAQGFDLVLLYTILFFFARCS